MHFLQNYIKKDQTKSSFNSVKIVISGGQLNLIEMPLTPAPREV